MHERHDPSPPPGDPALRSSRRVARNAIVRSAGEIVAKTASVAFYVAIARSLGTEGFGDFMFALSLTTVLILASGFGTEELITRDVARERWRIHPYLANVVAIKVVTSVLLLGAAIAIVSLGGYPGDTRLAVVVVGVGVLIDNLGRTWYAVFQAYQRMEFISATLILQRIVTAAGGVAILLAGGGLLATSVVFTGGALIGLAATGIALRRFVVVPRWKLDRSRWVPLLKAATPIGLASLLLVVLLKIDAVLLGLLRGGADNSEVGVYGAAFRLVESTMFLTWSFAAALLPFLARIPETRSALTARTYERGLKLMTAILLPIGLTFALLAAPLIHLIYGEQFDGAVLTLQLLGVMTILYGVNDMAATVLIARDRPHDFTRVVGLVAAENIVMNLVLIPPYGAAGAAFNAALSATLLAVASIHKVTSIVGPVRLWRAFAGPLVGGAVLAGAVTATSVPLGPSLAIAGAAYAATLAAFEWLAFPDDVQLLVRLLRRPPRVRGGPITETERVTELRAEG